MKNTALPQVVQEFIDSIKDIKWFRNHGEIPEGVLMFETWEDARCAAAIVQSSDGCCEQEWNGAYDDAQYSVVHAACCFGIDSSSADDCAREAARASITKGMVSMGLEVSFEFPFEVEESAELYSQYLFASDLQLQQNHVDYIKKRWSVWQNGYGVLLDIDGILYCYRRP